MQLHWYTSFDVKRREVLWVFYPEAALSCKATFVTPLLFFRKTKNSEMGVLLPVKISSSMFSNGYELLLSGTWNTLACLMLLISLCICGSFFLCLLPLVPGASELMSEFPFVHPYRSQQRMDMLYLIKQTKENVLLQCWAETSVQRESTGKIKLQED